jgi:hypothetical protein
MFGNHFFGVTSRLLQRRKRLSLPAVSQSNTDVSEKSAPLRSEHGSSSEASPEFRLIEAQ